MSNSVPKVYYWKIQQGRAYSLLGISTEGEGAGQEVPRYVQYYEQPCDSAAESRAGTKRLASFFCSELISKNVFTWTGSSNLQSGQ